MLNICTCWGVCEGAAADVSETMDEGKQREGLPRLKSYWCFQWKWWFSPVDMVWAFRLCWRNKAQVWSNRSFFFLEYSFKKAFMVVRKCTSGYHSRNQCSRCPLWPDAVAGRQSLGTTDHMWVCVWGEVRLVLSYTVRVTSAAPCEAPLTIRHLEVTMTALFAQTMLSEGPG